MRPLILITNDDGVNSPGLIAAGEAVQHLGDLRTGHSNVQYRN